MALSKRERLIALGVGVAALIYLGDSYVVDPYTVSKNQAKDRVAVLDKELEGNRKLFREQRRMEKSWNDMLASGLKSDPSEAEQQLLRSMRDWAQEAGLTLGSLKPDRVLRSDKTQLVKLNATGTGPVAAAAQLLWRIETAPIPLKVDDLQLTTRKEGTDDLTLTLSVSTLWVAPGSETSARPQVARGDAR